MSEALEVSLETQEDTSFRDPLTGLCSHGLFQLALDREVKRARRYGTPFTLATIDVDSFSRHRQRFGGSQGASLLREIGDLIERNTRELDLASRCGTDAFAVILDGAEARAAHIAAERIRRAVEARFREGPTVSIGLACCPRDATRASDLVKVSQEALLLAKANGKNTCFFYDTQEPSDSEKPTVLVVDDEEIIRELMQALLEQLSVDVVQAKDGEEALSIVNSTDVDLILLDVVMPGMNGYQVCQRLKRGDRTRLIPVILLTGLDLPEDKIKGIEAGADDFLVKPPNQEELLARTQSLIKVKGLNDNLISIESVLFSLAGAVEAKDVYTQGHIVRTSQMAVVLGKRLGVNETEIRALRLGGMLHDIGKIGVPRQILNKPGSLTDDEWQIIRSHPDVGYTVCAPLQKTLGPALEIIRYHHERLDGSGYPDGLLGDQIPRVARIMAVADMYDALVTDRPYRQAMTKRESIAILRQTSREGKLDAEIVEQLVEIVSG
jgi:putative two-component system response regulator